MRVRPLASGVVIAGALVACASIVGVDEPELDPTIGVSSNDAAPTATAEASPACSNTTSDPANCGGCGLVCNGINTARPPGCTGGSCTFECSVGFGHCAIGNTGCETDLRTTAAHCGKCGEDCAKERKIKNAAGTRCVAGKCGHTACQPWFADRNGDPTDGCEAACGGRDQPCCPAAGGAQECKPGQSLECDNGTCKVDS